MSGWARVEQSRGTCARARAARSEEVHEVEAAHVGVLHGADGGVRHGGEGRELGLHAPPPARQTRAPHMCAHLGAKRSQAMRVRYLEVAFEADERTLVAHLAARDRDVNTHHENRGVETHIPTLASRQLPISGRTLACDEMSGRGPGDTWSQ